MGVLCLRDHECGGPGVRHRVHTRDKGVLFGTNINGAGESVSTTRIAFRTALFGQRCGFCIQLDHNDT